MGRLVTQLNMVKNPYLVSDLAEVTTFWLPVSAILRLGAGNFPLDTMSNPCEYFRTLCPWLDPFGA